MAAAFARFAKKRLAQRERALGDPRLGRSRNNVTTVCAKVYFLTPSGSMSFARHRRITQEA
jgi:hypothetical protein